MNRSPLLHRKPSHLATRHADAVIVSRPIGNPIQPRAVVASHGDVPFRVIGIKGRFVVVVMTILFMSLRVQNMRRLKHQVPFFVNVQHHSPRQANTAAKQNRQTQQTRDDRPDRHANDSIGEKQTCPAVCRHEKTRVTRGFSVTPRGFEASKNWYSDLRNTTRRTKFLSLGWLSRRLRPCLTVRPENVAGHKPANAAATARRSRASAAILFADTGSEKEQTYAYLPVIRRLLVEHEFPPLTIVRYQPRHAPYHTLEGNMVKNATLTGATFNRGSCTMKFKIVPQSRWTSRCRRGP